MYNAVNNGNPTISLGSASAERLIITANYDSGAQTLCNVEFATAAASGTANKGKFVFDVDGTDIATIDDGGIDIASGKTFSINGSDISTSDTTYTAGDGLTLTGTDFDLDAALTTVTSVYNASLKVGRDSGNLIDFATTDNKLIFRVECVNEVELVQNALSPVTSDGVALGTSSLMWSDAFLASGSVINFNNGDITLTHSACTLTMAGGTLAAPTILATDIKIGEDDQTKVDFADADIINLHANNIKALSVHNTSSKGELRFYEGCNYVGFAAPALSGNQVWALPTADGSCGQVLSTNGCGVLSWASASSGGCVVCDSSPQLGGSLDAQTNTILNIGHACNDILATGIRVIAGSAACPSLSFTGDPNTGLYSRTGDALDIAAGGTQAFSIDGSAKTFIGQDTANSKMGRGLTINQGGHDTEILAFKSCDVGHGITSYAEADTYGFLKKLYAGNGGLSVSGFSDAACKSGLDLYAASCGAANDAKSTSALGLIQMRSEVRNPSNTSTTNAATDANMVVMRNGDGQTRFIFDNEGSGHADVEWTTYSDGRLKSNRAEVPYGLDTLMQLRPQIYCRDSGYLDDGNPVLEGTPYRHIGFIAQEVKALVPEIIDDVCESKSWYSLNDGKLTAVVVKAVQELEARVTALEGN